MHQSPSYPNFRRLPFGAHDVFVGNDVFWLVEDGGRRVLCVCVLCVLCVLCVCECVDLIPLALTVVDSSSWTPRRSLWKIAHTNKNKTQQRLSTARVSAAQERKVQVVELLLSSDQSSMAVSRGSR